MPLRSKVSGSWQKTSLPMTRVSGAWKPAKQVWTKVGGQWKKVFDLETADPFDGSGNLDGQDTPGSAPWKVYNGSWTKSGGNAVAGSLNSVAGIETGISENIELEIDVNASESGAGTAFWIQDQSNWWGAQTFYQTYSFTNSPTTVFYNFSCTPTFYNVTTNSNSPTTSVSASTSTNYNTRGNNFSTGSRFCSANGVMSSYTASATGCIGTCSTQIAPGSGSACSPRSTVFPVTSCGSSCSNCNPIPSPEFYNFSPTFLTNCPSPVTQFSSNPCAGTVASFFSVTYSCTTTPGSAIGCTHAVATTGNAFLSNSTSQDFRSYTPPCAGSTSFSCVASSSSITTPGNTVTSTAKQTRLIRSIAGSVSPISGTINNIGDGNNIGGILTRITPTQVQVTAYSSAARTGTAFPTQTYSIGPGTSKGTKHGILVSGVPSSQTYSISRFKATLT